MRLRLYFRKSRKAKLMPQGAEAAKEAWTKQPREHG
jgi:hypothetical protein